MASYKDGISPNIRELVKKINEVGVRDIVNFCDKNKPRTNIRRAIKIVRSVAMKGYTYTGYEFGISRQAAENMMKRIYAIALEVEEQKMSKKKTNCEIGQRMYVEIYRVFGTGNRAALMIGADHSSIVNWGKGVAPSAMFLAKLMKHGGDVGYVLTGERSVSNG